MQRPTQYNFFADEQKSKSDGSGSISDLASSILGEGFRVIAIDDSKMDIKKQKKGAANVSWRKFCQVKFHA